MKRLAILSAALATGVAIALAVGYFLIPKAPPSETMMAHWKNIYKTTGGLVAGADLILIAEHVSAEPGRVVGEGDDATLFTNNTFAVGSIMKGEHEGSTLVLEQTGGIMADGTVFNINDGGAYEPGRSYVLFLRSTGEGDAYYLINYQARYAVVDGALEGVDPTDDVVARMHRSSLYKGVDMIQKRVKMME